jgi:tellurite resistance protein TehA-like permease
VSAGPAAPPAVDGLLDRILGAVSPASGAVVMGTGIVSIGLALDGRETLSRVVLVLAAVVWVVLGVLLPARAVRDRDRFRADVRTPAAFTAVAGTAVLGTRAALLGWRWVGVALLVVAFAIWLGLLAPVLRHWHVPTVGASFILTVGTQAVALLAAVLALAFRASWLLVPSAAGFVLGLAFYVFVLSRFEVRQLAVGLGDHWVTGGALAISTVVAGQFTLAAGRLGVVVHTAVLEDVALAVWAATMAWLPVLVVAEARHRRTRYSVRRWSTVFPVGMYATCSFVVGEVAGVTGIRDFARVWIWVAVALWAVVAIGLVRAVVRLLTAASGP